VDFQTVIFHFCGDIFKVEQSHCQVILVVVLLILDVPGIADFLSMGMG
jgi:hypothetical protein